MNVKNTSVLVGLIAVLSVATLAKTQPQSATLPPGVSEENWIPISDSVGIAIGGVRTERNGQRLGSGVLMARFQGEWIIFEDAAASLPRILPLK